MVWNNRQGGALGVSQLQGVFFKWKFWNANNSVNFKDILLFKVIMTSQTGHLIISNKIRGKKYYIITYISNNLKIKSFPENSFIRDESWNCSSFKCWLLLKYLVINLLLVKMIYFGLYSRYFLSDQWIRELCHFKL